MARPDHQAVLTELTAWIATEKPGYGRQELLEKIAELTAAHGVPENLLEQAIRIFRLPVAALDVPSQSPDAEPLAGAAAPPRASAVTGSSDDLGGHDERRRNGGEAVGAGADGPGR